MKYSCIFLFALMITGCNRVKYIEFNGSMPGINNGVFVIKDPAGTPLYSESIFNGKFNLKKVIQTPGYYDLFITPDITRDNKKHLYDVYLDAGTYTISTDTGKLDVYPTIRSSSDLQNQLTDYYLLATGRTHEAKTKIDALNDQLYGKNGPAIYSPAYNKMFNEVNDAIAAQDKIEAAAFEEFVNKYPQNQVEAHILSQIDYKKDPESYFRCYQKFNADQKATAEGKSEGDDLALLAKLAPGAPAPKLAAKTADGKTFDPKSLGKKIILVEFWRSDAAVSRSNHQDLLNSISSPLKNKDFGVISVSLDTKADVWAAAIKEDNLSWTQLSDLQGDKSPDMTNWSISAIPTYDLVDGNWHIIKRYVDYNQIGIEVGDYLKKAH